MESNELKATIFNIQGYSVQDGPGIRTTVFLKGCPLRCQWCSNPESQTKDKDVIHVRSKCAKCSRCAEICKHGAISAPTNGESDGFVSINHEICADCNVHSCVEGCYEAAIEDVGTPMTVSEVMETLIADFPFFQQSGGGVTLSGGEPLMEDEFCKELFKQCKANYIHTAIETTGCVSWERLKSVLEYTDLALYDLKHMDPTVHKTLTGVSNELILQNLERVFAETKVPVIIRIPVIPGANDSDVNMEASAVFMKKIGARSSLINV